MIRKDGKDHAKAKDDETDDEEKEQPAARGGCGLFVVRGERRGSVRVHIGVNLLAIFM